MSVAARFSMPGTEFQALAPPNSSTHGASGTADGSIGGRMADASGGSSSVTQKDSSAPAARSTASGGRGRPTSHGSGSAGEEEAAAAATAAMAAAVPMAEVNSSAGGMAAKRRRASNPPFWYSYNYGAVHFVVVSSEHDLHKHSTQYKVSGKTLHHASRPGSSFPADACGSMCCPDDPCGSFSHNPQLPAPDLCTAHRRTAATPVAGCSG